MKLKPRCFPESLDERKAVMGIAYASNGYILPCCWLDAKYVEPELKALGMFDEELKLSNNLNIETIVYSKQWINFIDILKNRPEEAVSKCRNTCGR